MGDNTRRMCSPQQDATFRNLTNGFSILRVPMKTIWTDEKNIKLISRRYFNLRKNIYGPSEIYIAWYQVPKR